VALALTSLLLVGGPLAPGARAEQLTPEVEARLAKGEVVVLLKSRHPIYYFNVYGVVNAPPDDVWRAITAYDRYNEFLPLVATAELRRRSGNTAWQYLKMDMPWPFIKHWVINENQEDRARGILSFKQAEGNVKLEYGYWQVTPLPDGKTRLLYNLTADPWMDFVPSWLVELVTRQIMPDVIKGVRKRVAADQGAKR
jgi:ribosome-associated toxin RatA of RatAB toxin-antitoxin module